MSNVQVLEFTLGDERYCIDIEYVTEVIQNSEDDLTEVPNAPEYLQGVLDLRGEMAAIIDPLEVFSIDQDEDFDQSKVVVFEEQVADGKKMGWAVDEVTRVSSIDRAEVEESDDEMIEGIINREDSFLIWTAPDTIAAEV